MAITIAYSIILAAFFIGFCLDSEEIEHLFVSIRAYLGLFLYSSFFLACTLLFYVSLRKLRTFPSFYKAHYKRYWALFFCILASFLGRLTMSVILSREELAKKIDDTIEKNSWFGPSLQFVSIFIGSLTPLIAMLYSLLDGIRQEKSVEEPFTVDVDDSLY